MFKKLVSHNDPKSPISEAFRTLRTNVQYANIEEQIQTILMTSSIQSEGKSTIVANYGVTLAQSGKKVLIIDCDLRRPTVHKTLRLHNTDGLINILMRESSLEEGIKDTGVQNLYAIVSGPIPPNPSEILGSNRMKELLNILKSHFDIILLDAPPIMPVTDSVILSTIADGTIVTVAVGETNRDVFKRAIDSLKNVGANILGTVINKANVKDGYYENYSYEYSS